MRSWHSSRLFLHVASSLFADKDVTAEAQLVDEVLDPTSSDYSLLIRHLGKVYPPSILCGEAKYAVRDISMGCKNGERFGLLGINGAG